MGWEPQAGGNGGSLPATTVSPIPHGTIGFTVKDDGNHSLFAIENIGTSTANFGVSMIAYGVNGLGPNGEAFAWGTDTSALTPFRDFFLSKVIGAGTVSDNDGIYISNGGANPASIGIGFPQPADSGGSYRLKVSSGAITQGALNLVQSVGQTANMLTLTSSGGADHLYVAPTSTNNWTTTMIGDATGAHLLFQVLDLPSQTGAQEFALNSDGSISKVGAITSSGNYQQTRSDGNPGYIDMSASSNGHVRLTAAATSDATVTLQTINHAPFVLGTNSAPRLTVSKDGSIVIGTAALATNATDGFLYVPTCAGAPTGTPTAWTGARAMLYDTTDDKLYVYNGSWKSATFA